MFCVLYWCSTPILLRQKLHSHEFQAVGECYLQNAMFGTAKELLEAYESHDGLYMWDPEIKDWEEYNEMSEMTDDERNFFLC